MYNLKKAAYLVAFCLSSILIQAQTESEELKNKKILWGFHIQAHHSNLLFDANDNSGSDAVVYEDGLGFGLGIQGEYLASNHLSVRTAASLSFNGGGYEYLVTDQNGEPLHRKFQELIPVSINPQLHGVFKLKDNGLSPYAVLGGSAYVAIPFGENSITQLIEINTTASLDLGIGLNVPKKYFDIAPELRYSYALNSLHNVVPNQDVYRHQISLIVAFKG